MRRFTGGLALLLLAAAAPLGGQQPPADDSLRIKFLDVGQADATLIQLGRKAVLVDASRGDDIVLYLEEEGVDSLVAAIGSHNHDDHIGGMDAVLDRTPVAVYFGNGRRAENQATVNVETILADRRIPAPRPPWPPIRLGDAKITVWPPPLTSEEGPEAENNHSLGVLVERGRFKALLTGDSQSEELGRWLESRRVPDVDVLKAAHHGARNGLTPGWLEATRPEVVVISVGAGNGYGHPEPWALRYYQLHGRKVLRTDRDGTVIVAVDALGGYSIATGTPLPR